MYSLTEEEQAERVKAWIRNYAPSIILGVALAIACIFAWRFWQQKQETFRVKASAHYEMLLGSLVGHDDAAVQYHASRLMEDYAKTPYAKLAALMLARQAVNTNKLTIAAEKLQWVIDQAHEPVLREIARIRLARVFLADNKADKALELLRIVDQPSYAAEIAEVKGDIYVKMGKKADARAAYAQALQGMSDSDAGKALLKMKYADLA
ncbi:tetratricopeptide repeat protein [soil metagenome]